VEHGQPDPLRARHRVLITGAGGQLGVALREVFPDADARPRAELDVTQPVIVEPAPELVLHAAAWTDVDGAEADEEGALLVNVEGTRNVAALGAPVVYFSSDYVFDGSKQEPYVESDEPAPRSAYGRSKLCGEQEVREGWIVRSSWLFGWMGHNFVRTMLRLVELPGGVWHVAADGETTWAEFADAIFEEAGLDCRVAPVTTEELGRPAPRPAYSVLRSEREGAPRLPHWRDGLRECLERLGA
jgi:dTDP-4-dehydrorhamnose reductase